MNRQEKAERYAREKLGNWCHIVHSAYEISQCTNGEVSVNDYLAGYNEAMSQPKHIFDGAAQVGEVRRFEGALVDVVGDEYNNCNNCIIEYNENTQGCMHITGCLVNNVKYIKR